MFFPETLTNQNDTLNHKVYNAENQGATKVLSNSPGYSQTS